MSIKYHINKKGEINECKAHTQGCKLDPIDSIHGYSVQEVQSAYDLRMSSKLLPNLSKSSSIKLSKADMNKLAKTTSEYDQLKEISVNGSLRSLSNLSKNENLNGLILINLARNTDDMERRDLIAEHPNFPIGYMNTHQFAKKLRSTKDASERRKIIQNSDLSDLHAEALREGKGRPNTALRTALRSSNSISEEFTRSVVDSGEVEAIQILENGKLPVDMISSKYVDTRLIPSGNSIHRRYTSQILNLMKEQDNTRDMIKLANNPMLSGADIDMIVENTDASNLKLYSSESISENAKRIIESRNPMAYSKNKFDEMYGRDFDNAKNGLIHSLVLEDNSNTPKAFRGYTDLDYTLDTKKVKELGLNASDIAYLMQGRYSHAFSYNEETGKATGVFDSTD